MSCSCRCDGKCCSPKTACVGITASSALWGELLHSFQCRAFFKGLDEKWNNETALEWADVLKLKVYLNFIKEYRLWQINQDTEETISSAQLSFYLTKCLLINQTLYLKPKHKSAKTKRHLKCSFFRCYWEVVVFMALLSTWHDKELVILIQATDPDSLRELAITIHRNVPGSKQGIHTIIQNMIGSKLKS